MTKEPDFLAEGGGYQTITPQECILQIVTQLEIGAQTQISTPNSIPSGIQITRENITSCHA